MPEATKRPPFMTNPAHLTVLAGQKYVVLRVGGEVGRVFQESQELLLARLRGLPVGYPNAGHVTLRGFPPGTDYDRVSQVLDVWSKETPPLVVETERPGYFGPPHQAIILRVRRTDALVTAYARLAELADRAGLPAIAETGRPIEEWIFHVSVLYCRAVPAADWARVVELVERLSLPTARCVVADAELVCFDDEGEHQTLYLLEGQPPT